MQQTLRVQTFTNAVIEDTFLFHELSLHPPTTLRDAVMMAERTEHARRMADGRGPADGRDDLKGDSTTKKDRDGTTRLRQVHVATDTTSGPDDSAPEDNQDDQQATGGRRSRRRGRRLRLQQPADQAEEPNPVSGDDSGMPGDEDNQSEGNYDQLSPGGSEMAQER